MLKASMQICILLFYQLMVIIMLLYVCHATHERQSAKIMHDSASIMMRVC